MKEWKTPKLQVYDLKEVAKEIYVNARSGGGGCLGCRPCGTCKSCYYK